MKKLTLGFILLVVVAGLAATVGRAQDWPLTQDDIKILLIGGAKPEKMVEMIKRRGVDFQMNPDLAKKFHDLGATDDVIDALQSAAAKRPSSGGASAAPAAPAASSPPASSASTTPAASTPAAPAASSKSTESVQEKINKALAEKTAVIDETASASAPSSNATKTAAPAKTAALTDPNPQEIAHIVQEFAAKEKLFKQARDNYAYHQINKVDQMGENNEVVGTYRQDWDILFDNAGKRIEQVTYAPLPTLKGLSVTQEDINSFRSIQPFVLTTDDLPEYDIKYLGHVKVDEITAYVFKVRPIELKKGKQYFDGIVWVDDRDLQIVKSEGKPVPEIKSKGGQENLFPRFTTYREQIDGKFWFPTYTMADDTLYFPGNPIRIKEVIRYTNYKQFKASSTIKVVGELNDDKSKTPDKPNPNPPKQ